MKRNSKIFNIATTLLKITFEIILLPFHIAAAIIDAIEETRR